MTITPSFKEDQISQVPALQLLINLGFEYLPPAEALRERKGKRSKVILEGILDESLRRINQIDFKGQIYPFSNHNIDLAIQDLQDFPLDGLLRTNEQIYDLLCLGKSYEETFEGSTRSFSLRYIDWKNWENNAFHVTAEYEVERWNSTQTCRPDIIAFVNGIPLIVIECKRPDIKDSLEQAISQNLRNQSSENIPTLFLYSQIVMAINKQEGKYGTTGTESKFWSCWKEKEFGKERIHQWVNRPLSPEQKDGLFSGIFARLRAYFDQLESQGERMVTGQDQLISSLCYPPRLMELIRKFILFDGGVKKIARYQQYCAVRETIHRVKNRNWDGSRQGGVIWHTQGSGKSLTMVMLGKCLVMDPDIRDPRIVLVTDRVNLDKQIFDTFRNCDQFPIRARTGRHLLELLSKDQTGVITTVIGKFTSALNQREIQLDSPNIFVLVDESHRTQYGELHTQMRKVFHKACFIGFTGTPLQKKDKSTLDKFGGLIHTYTIDDAVPDGSVLPLLYEGRHVPQKVDAGRIDNWFERIAADLTDQQKRHLKKKFSRSEMVKKAEQRLWMVAYDISDHFEKTAKGTGFKGQLVTRSKKEALKYRNLLAEIGKVTAEVLISPPDTREGYDEVNKPSSSAVVVFWKEMMDRYGSEKEYNDQLIDQFKCEDHPQIIIVVDKLITGFDAPRNTFLYLDRRMKSHQLLQTIARVNRLYEGKEFGFIIDYEGLLTELDAALEEYRELADFEYDLEDLRGTWTNIIKEAEKLPQKYSELRDIFKGVKNKADAEAHEVLLGDEALREKFYEKLSQFARTLKVALSCLEFHQKTDPKIIGRYKRDLKFYLNLRASVAKRYGEKVDFKEFEPQIKKLIDTYVGSDKVKKINDPVNIFERDRFDLEVSKAQNPRAKADMIAYRIRKTITEKMEEDPAFYEKFSVLIKKTLEELKQQRLDDAEYLKRMQKYLKQMRNRSGEDLPAKLKNKEVALAFYGVVLKELTALLGDKAKSQDLAVDAGLRIDEIIQANLIVDWDRKEDIQKEMENQMEDYFYDLEDQGTLTLPTDQLDRILEQSIRIAKKRYPR